MEKKSDNSIEKIWNEYYDQLLLFIIKRVSDKAIAEDILQNVFVKILFNIKSLKDNTKMKNWLFQITRNEIINYFRESKATGKVPLFYQAVDNEVTHDITEEVGTWIVPFIGTLPEKYQEALILSEIDGMSQKDLAAHLGISYSGAKTRVQRGRAMLKEKLTQCCIFHTDKYGNIMDYNPNTDSCNTCD